MFQKVFLAFLACIVLLFSQEKKVQVAVLDIEDPALQKSESIALTERLIHYLEQTDQYTLLDRGMTTTILKEQGFQQSGCTSGECAVEVGQLLGVQKMVSCKIGAVGKYYTISIRMIDVTTGKIEKSVAHDVVGSVEDVLISGLKQAVNLLVGKSVVVAPEIVDPKVLKIEKLKAEKAAREAAEKIEQEQSAKVLAEKEAKRKAAAAELEIQMRAKEDSTRMAKIEASKAAKVEADRIAKLEADRIAQAEAELASRTAKEKALRVEADAQKVAQAEADKAARIAKAAAERDARIEAEKAERLAKENAVKQLSPEEIFVRNKRFKVVIFSGIAGASAVVSGISWGAKSGHHKTYLAASDQITMDDAIEKETSSMIVGSITAGVSAICIPLTVISLKKKYKASAVDVSFAPVVSSQSAGVMVRGEF